MYDGAERDITPIGAHQAEREKHGLSISVETLAWVGLIVAAGLLRLADLGGEPLTTDEGARAFEAARVAGGEVPDSWRGDLAAAATSYLFRIFGETEMVARLVPAIAGVALVGVLWFARPWAGRAGAVAAGALVAASPLFVIHSRSAGEFSLGSLVGAAIMVSLFGYLRSPRLALAFPLIVALALAPLTDAPAVLAALTALVFLAMEVSLFSNREVRRAWQSFRLSPMQWVIALLVVAAALQLGVTHFGTSLERVELPGLRLFGDMFDLPRDARAGEYFFALLLGYDWPLVLAGGAGFAFCVIKLARGPRTAVTAVERLLLVWTIAAVVTLALIARRESGQLLMLLLPLALLAGRLVEEIAAGVDWTAAGRWWPSAATAVALAAAAAVLMTEWSAGRADAMERSLLIALPVACIALIAVLSMISRAGAAAAVAGVVTVAAVAFAAHSSSAAAFAGGTEFAVDMRTEGRNEQLRETLDRLAAERNGTVVVDQELIDELGWTLRDSPAVFGGPIEGAAAVVSRPDANPPGFAGREEVWRVAEGWYPDEVLAPRRMWRWLLHRRPYEGVEVVEVRIYVRTI